MQAVGKRGGLKIVFQCFLFVKMLFSTIILLKNNFLNFNFIYIVLS